MRIRQFESVRDAFTGPLANTVLDLPFVLVFVAAVFLVGGNIAWIAVALIALYAIMAAVAIPMTRHRVSVMGEARSRWQNFLLEALSKQAALRRHGVEDLWCERARPLIGAAATRQFRAQQLNFTIQTLSQALVMLAGVATIWVGALMVMRDELTVGALIAVLAMVWRVLAPINSAFLSILRLGQVVQTFKQINGLMRIGLERVPGRLATIYRVFGNAIDLARVSFRYSAHSEPALIGASLAIPSGQLVAVTGPSGAGKSTILKLIAGLYVPQAGAVQIDQIDVRQLDVGELRHAIAYMPQKLTFFHGTIDQNLRLACPTADERDVERACREAGVRHYDNVLSEGYGTRLTSEFQASMPDGLKQRLALARTWVKQSSIILLDEPATHLDQAGEEALMRKLAALRGKATIIMVTHRPSHMRLADRVVYMERGQIVHDAKPDQVLPLIMNAA
jgi:ABC-type bacteriocin/lantibiotic exporter with double-glycine peptidase domain